MDDVLEPKYYNEKTKKFELDSVELTKRRTTLDSILGTYRWFYYSYPNRDGDIEMNSGYITLEKKTKSKTTLANVSGSLQLHVHDGKFHGLKKSKEKKIIARNEWGVAATRETGKNRKNFWEIKEIEWEGRSELDSEGNGFGVCEVKDDNGNPFLKFEWGDMESGGCHSGPEFGFYLGKKVRSQSVEECELSEDEQERLGMLWSLEDIREVEEKGYISDSEGSNEDVVEESDEAQVEVGLKRELTDEGQEVSSSNKKARKA